MMREGAITTILTYRYDRFGRNLRQALSHLEEVEALGGQVVSATEPIDASTAIGQYMRSHSLALAELQSRQIGESWKRVQQYRIDRGPPTDGRERYGYLAHRSTHTRSDGALRICPQGCASGDCKTGFVPDPETAPIVQRIYREYLDGRGSQKIAHGLNDDGVPTPVSSPRSGPGRPSASPRPPPRSGLPARSSTSRTAASPPASSPTTASGTPGAHEPLITAEEWAAYQTRRDAQRQVPTKARSPRWSLAGIAVCGDCGGPMYCSTTNRGQQYQVWCGRSRNSGACQGVYRSRVAVEAAVGLWLQGQVRERREGSSLTLPEAQTRRQDPHNAERQRLNRLLDRADAKIERLLHGSSDGALNLAEYKVRREAVQRDVEQARRRLNELDQPKPDAPPAAAVITWAEMWSTMPECDNS